MSLEGGIGDIQVCLSPILPFHFVLYYDPNNSIIWQQKNYYCAKFKIFGTNY